MALINLNLLKDRLVKDYQENFDSKDIEIPTSFKSEVESIDNNVITYYKYSVKIHSTSNLDMYIPNQWFYIASFFTEYYIELEKYRDIALSLYSKDALKGHNSLSLSDAEMKKLDSLDLLQEEKEFMNKFITDYSWWGGGKTIDRNDFFVSPIIYFASLVNATSGYLADICAFLAKKPNCAKLLHDTNTNSKILEHYTAPNQPLQQIYYGAPGTGKSFGIKTKIVNSKNIRTIFHPDSDYSTFVGAYKPIIEPRPRYGLNQKETVRLKDESGKPLTEEVITYKFVPQAFIKAYLKAWKLMAEAKESGESPKPFYLVIEEINRGNCAQIFGDVFQLLDRNRNGFSSYEIVPDSDIQKFLKEDNELGFGKGLQVSDVVNDHGEIIATSDEIRNGEKLVLPPNLHIWATMNTSDQSLFPIDSAFKRRWAWKYVKIKDAKKNWTIEADDKSYDWYEFIQSINEVINNMTSSADKQLGYFFCKASKKASETDAEPTIITAETFVGKVLFYLWNDVFKEYGFDNSELFKFTKTDEGKSVQADLTFPDFYNDDNEVNVGIMSQFIDNVLGWKSDENK
ncbi:hypothetical protein prwr041_00620 [Prevotella herbatica]|uniref:ATPase dynein-related AAA domain-containing protein n=1 Tax=Prevotella herbatica TaxID=2801997 RepID=A0ABM7NUS2_9BACT|nr:hypothetical protein [Prevotella herbatica]BCS84169.1 hypothetical protein prwr041_00620 [Prevotella herbatica]